MNITDIFTIKYLKEYLSRNKELFIIAAILLILSAIGGVILSEYIKTVVTAIFKQMIEGMPKNPTFIDEATSLFLNNIKVNLLIIASGILFSVISIIITIVNGVLIGYVYTMVTPIQWFIGIFPHGIFELSAFIIALTGSFIVTKLEIKLIKALFNYKFKEEIKKSDIMIKDIILSIILVFVLLIIAAIIEAGVTPILLNMVR